MKKVKIVFWVIFAIIAFLAINFIRTFNLLRNFNDNTKDMKGQLNARFNDNNFPEFSKKFLWVKKDDTITTFSENTLYDTEYNKKIIEETEKYLPENLKEYQTELAPSILELMKKEKTKKYPTAEETEKYPESPKHKSVRQTVRFWANLSLVFGEKGDYKTSLLIAHGIFYLTREILSSYCDSGNMMHKMLSVSYLKLASKSILVWASHPHPECAELSKTVAKDILKFVETDYPLSRNIEYIKYSIDTILKYLSQKTSLVGSNVFNKSYYKEVIDLFVNEPLKLESKSYYEVKDEYAKFSKKVEDAINTGKYDKVFPNYFINPEKAIVYYLARMFWFKHISTKTTIEDSLAYMEFAAVALLINSYYCQNGNLPQSMEELEKWFGQKLPVSRLDNKPYVIDTNGKHLLTFKHMSNNFSENQLYFDFFK